MAAEGEIDHDLYSRQYYVYGKEAMQKMANSTVLVSGLSGVGVEIAKNVALAGVRQLTLHDTLPVSQLDLSAQFYAGEADIGQNRAEVSASKVKELNPYTKVDSLTVDLLGNLDELSKFSVVCLCNYPLAEQLVVNDYCRSHNIRFISCESRGLSCSVFVDVGQGFKVYDKDGEELKEIIIGDVVRGEETTIRCLPNHLHGLDEGNWVMFREVKGVDELNGGKYHVVKKTPRPNEFVIDFDSSKAAAYVQGTGIAQQVKEVVTVNHASLADSLDKPEFLLCDFAKLDAPPQIHLAYRAVNAFYDAEGRWPAPWSADADKVLAQAALVNSKVPEDSPARVGEVDDKLVKLVANTWQGQFSPISAFVGGCVGQEVLKSVSGKFTPLNQHFYLDFKEIAPGNDNVKLEKSRYDGQIICLGNEANAELQKLRLFMVGSGAIGCELLKTLAMMGCSLKEAGGELVVTDDDIIERSNLNRQFLFRDSDIGHPKSTSAAGAALKMNPGMNIDPHKRRVEPKTEDVYNDNFFDSRHCVLNALDNIQARRYVDQRCTTAQRALLESGTMGTKGHVQVIVPFLTETYSQQNDPESKDVPFCTLKSFPHEINHCVQWARALAFEQHFVSKPRLWKQFMETENVLDILRSPKVRSLKPWVLTKMLDTRPTDFQRCVDFARLKFEKYFNHAPRDLLNAFPLDHTIDGKPFWSNPKRPPHPLEFNFEDDICQQFIVAFANLWAFVWGVPQTRDIKAIAKMVEKSPVPKYVPKKKNIETDESVSAEKAEEQKQDKVSEDAIKGYIEKLEGVVKEGFPFQVNAVEFEKDDDSNFHIDCIDAISNLRARVYKIPEIDRFETKKIAGRIIPAIAATTACVSGLAMVELVKIMQKKKLEDYKSSFFNLSLPQFTFSEPGEVRKEKIAKGLFGTIWDRWEIRKGDMTVEDLLSYAEEEFKIDVGAIFVGAKCLYNGLMPAHRKKLGVNISELLKLKEKVEYVDLLLVVEDEEDEDEDEDEDEEEESGGPVVRFYF
mmetsp:Transcript_33024/g.92448  ORF Transcript_33024/g.92448 Transcript_33024/m.92448 type:complete len:1015 (+) Transcript_33024:148-3192(+)